MATFSPTSHHRPYTAAYKREQRLRDDKPKMVRLVICCDGTGNTPTCRTNVRRIWECLLGTRFDGSQEVQGSMWSNTEDDLQKDLPWQDKHEQINFYQVGITSSIPQQLTGKGKLVVQTSVNGLVLTAIRDPQKDQRSIQIHLRQVDSC